MADKKKKKPKPTVRSDETAILVQDLHIEYRSYRDRTVNLRDRFTGAAKDREYDIVRAARGIDLEVKVGESIGVVGTNGSGKSTLLAAIAGLIRPTRGSVLVRSQPALLGVRAALRGDLSGAANIRLGGLALGMRSSEVDEKFDEIAQFAALGEALGRPLRTYSSGMRARLAFSIAMSQRPKILLVDEALAVGDRRFRKASLAKLREIRAEASTVIIVTHHMREIKETCERVIWIDDGLIVADGPTNEVVSAYQEMY